MAIYNSDNPSILPTDIVLHKRSRVLEVSFADGQKFELDCEYLRVYSPSAEVRGHGPGGETLQVGKQNVNINAIDPIGNYAVRLVFDDGHSSGLYSWNYLYDLGVNKEAYWADYLRRLAEKGLQR